MGNVVVTTPSLERLSAATSKSVRPALNIIWPVAGCLIAAVASVIFIAYGVGLLRQEANNCLKATDLVNHLQIVAARLPALDALETAGAPVNSLSAEAQAAQTDIAATLTELSRIEPGPQSDAVARTLAAFNAAEEQFDQAVAAGSAEATFSLYREQVEPAYGAFLAALAVAGRTYGEEGARAGVAAGLGSLGTTLLAAVVMGLLTWLFERARQAAKLRAAEQRVSVLAQSEERFRSLVQNTADVIMVLDGEGCVTYASPSVERILGYSADELRGKHLSALAHGDERQKVERFLTDALRKPGKSVATGFRAQHARGYWIFLDAIGNNLTDNPSVGGLLLSARDISERWMLEEQLAHQAFHDSLTKLPNRALFMDRLGQALLRGGRLGTRTAVLFLDLNDFKVVNDTLGHPAGDQLLTAVGERLRDSVRDADTVARLGGDEFTVLLADVESEDDATVLAERVAACLQTPFTLNGQKVFVSAAIGIAVSDGQADQPEDLLRNSDIAMYDAKNGRKSGYALYQPAMNQRAWRRLELEVELRDALEHGQFRVHYQPVVELSSGQLTEVEALVRWLHPTRGLIAPIEFIPVAEETGLIVQLGNWVLREATRQMMAWQQELPAARQLTLSANLSGRQFLDKNLVADIAAALNDSGFPAAQLKLEITETVALENSGATLETLRQLKALGLRLAIDDFGTGYSALSYLKHYPVDTLKIDRSFVKGLGSDPGDTGIVHAVIAFARTLKLQVTAEGIETVEQLDQLRALGCDYGQGYYFAKPLPPTEVVQLIGKRPVALAQLPAIAVSV